MQPAIFNEEGIAHYYLPEGIWTNYLTGETAIGGSWRKEQHGYLSIPLWVRENSIVPVGNNSECADYIFTDNLEMKVFALQDKAETTVYQAGKEVLTLCLEKYGQKIAGKVQGTSKCKVRLVNCAVDNIIGASMERDGADTVVTVENVGKEFVCEVTI